MIAPDIFELSDIDGHATATSDEVPADQQRSVREAASSCPEKAITITE
jgi:ferredoxin